MLSFTLQALGLLTLLTLLHRLAAFLHLYFLHTSTLRKYLHHPGTTKSYALITGASDGIGLALARQLLHHGFNVILHGRNPEKLDRLTTQLTADFPSQKTLSIAADAASPSTSSSVSKIVEYINSTLNDDEKLTVLINNVGGSSLFGISPYATFNTMPSDAVNASINLNAKFPVLLTHALLPTLAKNRPSLVVNVGSYAGVWGLPYLTTYSPSKAFNHMFSAALAKEIPVAGLSGIEVLGVIIGSVVTPGNPNERIDFKTLTAEEVARSILGRVGCGWRAAVVADWRQCVAGQLMGWVPGTVAERVLEKEMRVRAEREERRV